MAKAMDDAHRWLNEIKEDLVQAQALLALGHQRGDWGKVVEGKRILSNLQNRLSNLEQLALPENWRMLAERNGVRVEDENDGIDQTKSE
jgi:hypothetical protein